MFLIIINIVANLSKTENLLLFEAIYAEPKYKIEKIDQLIVIFLNSSLMFS